MNIIKEFSDFKKWNVTPITLNLPGGIKVYFDSDKVKEIRKEIKDYLRTIPEFDLYSENRDIVVSGKTINSEFISKLPNNISVLYGIWNIAKRLGHIIDNADDFILWVSSNLEDLFNPSGKYFDEIYIRLNKAADIGKSKELDANDFFTSYAKDNGLNITLLSPSTKEEDSIGGIDYYFIHNGKKITIQVKSLDSISQELYNNEKCYAAKIGGDFTDIKTNYLILMSKKEGYPSYIFRNVKDDRKIVIDRERSIYIIPEGNLVIKK